MRIKAKSDTPRPAGRFRKELFVKQPGKHPGQRIVLSEHGDARLGKYLVTHKLGHLLATYPAGFTAEGRDGTPFTPPSSPHVTPIPLRFISDDRYWWTRGTDAGTGKRRSHWDGLTLSLTAGLPITTCPNTI